MTPLRRAEGCEENIAYLMEGSLETLFLGYVKYTFNGRILNLRRNKR